MFYFWWIVIFLWSHASLLILVILHTEPGQLACFIKSWLNVCVADAKGSARLAYLSYLIFYDFLDQNTDGPDLKINLKISTYCKKTHNPNSYLLFRPVIINTIIIVFI